MNNFPIPFVCFFAAAFDRLKCEYHYRDMSASQNSGNISQEGNIDSDNTNSNLAKRQKTAGTKRLASTRVMNPEARYYDAEERAFYNNLDDETKLQISNLEKDIRNLNCVDVPLRFKVLMSNIDSAVKALAVKKLRGLYEMDESSGEYHKIKYWIESLCRLPIGKYVGLPVGVHSPLDSIRGFLSDIQIQLDTTVYGHKTAKDQIIRLLAQWIRNPTSKGLVVGIQGAAGTGKTSLVKKGICDALRLPFAFLALGGASDASFLDGFSYTYEGARWGKVADILMRTGCMNPVIYFDELDKVSSGYRGDEITNVLIHLTDSSQNDSFTDKYFTDVELDLSRCLLVFSYNNEACINPILKDRMITIRTEPYKLDDKMVIAKQYLMKELSAQFGIHVNDIVFSDQILRYIVDVKVDKEEGVRNFKRGLESIYSNLNLQVLLDPSNYQFPIHVTHKMVDKYIVNSKESSDDRMKMASIYS
jgi:ATP-dependent Lon protease